MCDCRVGIGVRLSSWYWRATVELVLACDGRVGLACDGQVGGDVPRSSWYWRATFELVLACDGRVGIGVRLSSWC